MTAWVRALHVGHASGWQERRGFFFVVCVTIIPLLVTTGKKRQFPIIRRVRFSFLDDPVGHSFSTDDVRRDMPVPLGEGFPVADGRAE